ncbi:MAG: DNA topoisomerase, partial [Candidatus Hydrothermarchaeales archaeon]
LRPRQGKKTDPAHPAIYPTGILPKKLTRDEDALYGLVVHRFMAIFGDPQLKEDVEVLIKIGGEVYRSSGSKTKYKGWTELYPYTKIKDHPLPELKEGDLLNVLKVYQVQKETKPPRRYNPASLVKELESRNLGTKATRADIIDTLYRRNYIVGGMMEATVLGTKVIDALEMYAPEIISEKLTRRFEEKIEGIRNGNEDKEGVLNEAKDELLKIMKEFKENDEKMGEVLKQALDEVYRKQYVVGKCPNCGQDLRIIRSKNTKKIFIGCANYPKCSTSYPLPQKTGIRTTDKLCKTCGLPMVSIPFKTRRILSCIDMNCPSKKRRKKSS